MARNRQRAKERQARRKAQGSGAGAPPEDAGTREDGAPAEPATPEPKAPEPEPTPPEAAAVPDAAPVPDTAENREEALEQAELAVGAPPEDIGRSDETLDYEQDVDAAEASGEDHFDPAKDHAEADGAPRSTRRADGTKRPRFVEFLVAVWAELQRVQWPNRSQLTTLTGVVLGFVLIAGGYLGLLDAIAQRIVNALI